MIAYETRSQEVSKCRYWVRSSKRRGIACVVEDKFVQLRAAADLPPSPESIALVWQGPKLLQQGRIVLPRVIECDGL